jgi:hypothetical protein
MLVKLTYFKPTGKYYTSGEYTTEIPPIQLGNSVQGAVHGPPLWKVWDEVKGMLEAKRLPGLVDGHSDFWVLVDVPDHPHNHPHLVLSGRWFAATRREEQRVNP